MVFYLERLVFPDQAFSTAVVCDPLPDSTGTKRKRGPRGGGRRRRVVKEEEAGGADLQAWGANGRGETDE